MSVAEFELRLGIILLLSQFCCVDRFFMLFSFPIKYLLNPRIESLKFEVIRL